MKITYFVTTTTKESSVASLTFQHRTFRSIALPFFLGNHKMCHSIRNLLGTLPCIILDPITDLRCGDVWGLADSNLSNTKRTDIFLFL